MRRLPHRGAFHRNKFRKFACRVPPSTTLIRGVRRGETLVLHLMVCASIFHDVHGDMGVELANFLPSSVWNRQRTLGVLMPSTSEPMSIRITSPQQNASAIISCLCRCGVMGSRSGSGVGKLVGREGFVSKQFALGASVSPRLRAANSLWSRARPWVRRGGEIS